MTLLIPSRFQIMIGMVILILLQGICETRYLESTDQESTSCMADTDCNNYPYKVCEQGVCEHKNIFPIYPLEFSGIIVLPIIMALCTIAGIGGGGVVIPFCMTFFVFSTKNAISISGFSILTCSITRFLININQKHPEKDAVVIDYSLATVMLPTVMMGSLIGVLLNVILPAMILQIILSFLLLVLSIQSGFKAR